MIIDVQDVTRKFTRGKSEIWAINKVSLQVNPGEFVAFTGPSGCGKTTLLQIIGLLDPDFEGRVLFEKRDVGQLSTRLRIRLRLERIGFVFQSCHLIPTLSVEENVALPHWYLHKHRGRAIARAKDLLFELGLQKRLRHYPRQLSGGEMQRTAVARALINDPVIIIADEPTAQLDQEATGRLLEIFGRLHNIGRTILLASHDPRVVKHAHRQVGLIYGNQLVAQQAQNGYHQICACALLGSEKIQGEA